MDSTDLKILKLLQKNAQYTHKEIADKIGLTITPVYERIKRLEKDGAIQCYVALLDQDQLNLSLVSFTNVSLKEHSKDYIKKFETEITKIESVVECYHIAGQYDYMLKIVIKDMKAYQSVVINQLASMENIANVTSSFVMTEVKKSTELPI
ncbi:MAG: AsnC family transcriptional regulator [Flammeovirgaceae bacterium]|nr:AsnC family transcriptional regulator [Flammeovirgaceae bacterium]MBR08748.1 AsnC family transcriptional regulator [Rickettsiales bacterium]|tara:strand:+ start:166 stop:618 length:453 start_codon:yes stop_codon:yes gene_type:complete